MIARVAWKRRRYGLCCAAAVAPVFHLVSRLALALDPLLFPALRRVRVEAPVIIIAHPRSGTTFLQRLLALEPQAAFFRTWEMLFPSILLRRLLRPFIRLAAWLDRVELQSPDRGHAITLDGVDEEEGLFLHHLDSELLTYLCPEGLVDPDYRERFLRLGRTDLTGSGESAAALREYLRRQLYLTGARRIIINSNPSVFRIRTLLEVFPDARFVFLSRPPEETVPSYLSLFANTAARRLNGEERWEFYRQKYSWSLQLYRYWKEVGDEIPPAQLLSLDFKRLVDDPVSCVDEVLRFANIAPSAGLWEALRRELEKPRERAHINYPLESFGISRRELERDFPRHPQS
jgi:hypothetical protein